MEVPMPKYDSTFDLAGYAPVADRIQQFYERFSAGRIVTELVSRHEGEIVFRALVYRDTTEPQPAATGWAAEREGDGDVNAVACLENAETSAIGRALANLGFTASTKRPSREEMTKANHARRRLTLDGGPVALESPQPGGARLQARADAVHDLLELLVVAERREFSPRRAAVIATRATRTPSIPFGRVRKLELAIRAWLRRRPM
jgi:hypothetical protein